MSFLLDTHVLLWWLFDDNRLSKRARSLAEDPSNKVFVSSVSAWEISTKHRLGKLESAATLVQDIAGWVQKAGFVGLPITLAHAQRAGSWLQEHRDPFDRMLAAQSAIENLPLVSRDPAFEAFAISVVW